MIFLKRIDAIGFKSFAEEIKLDFDYSMTGIVGPNGSGKSNINDAIMWALGEQSYKTLRGDSMEDIVFSGSSERKALNLAEVTLVFDNSNRNFSSLDFNEVSITRKYFRSTKESEYYINNSRVRLKDIQDVALETGLTKSSLAIISQGSISNFVESKPEDRRKLFDEAAGVARYKKRKDEAIRKLSRTQDNLDRINDIINEIERKLPSLKKQSKKAIEYNEAFNELKSIEVSVLLSDIKFYGSKIEELENEKVNLKTEMELLQKTFHKNNIEYNQLINTSESNDKDLSKLNKEFTKVVEKISELKVAKITLESKKENINIDDSEYKVSEIKHKAKSLEIEIDSEEGRLASLLKEKHEKKILLDNLSAERYKLNNEQEYLSKVISKLEIQIENMIAKKNSLENLFDGVKNVLENKNILPGVEGTVSEFIKVKPEHEVALSTALQNNMQNIIVKNTNSVKVAIEFLKSNNGGYATFLPLDTLRANYINEETKFIIKKTNGFIGFGNELAIIDKKFKIVLDYLLSNYLIVDSFENAVNISKITNSKFHVITLDGQRILPYGAIVGGSKKNKSINLFDTSKLEELQKEKDHNNEKVINLQSKIVSLSESIDIQREHHNEIQASIATSKKTSESLEKELNKIKNEFRILTGKDLTNDEVEFKSVDEQLIKLMEQISLENNNKAKIEQDINVIRSLKDQGTQKQNDLFKKLEVDRNMLSVLKEKMLTINSDRNLLKEKEFNAKNRLAQDYNLTLENALKIKETIIENESVVREKIKELRAKINSLGNVNIDSIEEYENENSRYETYLSQSNEISESIKNLKDAIVDMDHQMVEQFKKIISDVNKVLPETFATLFGGGTASIIYTEPNDILNTGIDLKLSPPGKKISNLNLLSGGEKSMVALSVLFSILKVRPIPLVILDEVEAPLDIANVERFAKYIKTFVNNTQFLIVTHRIGTMENCDKLFGATMEQKGITKIVQIKLVDAKKITNSN
ncbi:AAA family ATPase [Spiroplasma turonicum]|uniref:Chromosome partition protein Smc n=1 Tax=Spiroplasma turonicum TaxID=216946 RepID=A0A0K1P579_9MOLU|nr:AAA family ATPase [Spiroplasma turonicum]AKU79438.1 chromosome condensation and segregation SMC ATPase [Spiroplasma turonicum]ALX70460.1 chromosome condensation and segregation SMC ATPase [Spiroplasma turonicum]